MTIQNNTVANVDLHGTLDEIVSTRYSCRAFVPDEVPQETIQQILTTAQKTASWNNVQSWGVHLTSGKGTERFRKALSERAGSGAEHVRDIPGPREYAGVYLQRRRACGFGLYNAVGVERGDKAGYIRQTSRNFVFFDAPHVAVITSEEALGVYSAVDVGAYVANFMNAATSLGVATIAQGALAEHSTFIRDYFDIPDTRQLVCGISFGYPDLTHPANSFRTDREDIENVVTWVNE